MMNRRDRILVIVLAGSPVVLMPLTQVLALSSWGSVGWLWLVLPPCGTVALMAAAAIPTGLGMLVFRARRLQGLATLALAILALGAVVLGASVGERVRMAAFRRVAERSAPLVAAIHQYAVDHGAAPAKLAYLVPRHLPALPVTGLGAYPDYSYEVASKRVLRADNPWMISIPAPEGLLNWDEFIYLPRQNYPRMGFGGWLQRIGDWAYVHE